MSIYMVYANITMYLGFIVVLPFPHIVVVNGV